MNKKKTLVVLLAVLAIVAATLVILNQIEVLKYSKQQPTNQTIQTKTNFPPPPKYTKTDLPINKLSEVFPKDLIQEKDMVVLDNSEISFEDGKKQYVLQYASKKTIAENFELYKQYFISKKWSFGLQGLVLKDNYGMLSVFKDLDNLKVNFSLNSVGGTVIVDLTLMRYPGAVEK